MDSDLSSFEKLDKLLTRVGKEYLYNLPETGPIKTKYEISWFITLCLAWNKFKAYERLDSFANSIVWDHTCPFGALPDISNIIMNLNGNYRFADIRIVDGKIILSANAVYNNFKSYWDY